MLLYVCVKETPVEYLLKVNCSILFLSGPQMLNQSALLLCSHYSSCCKGQSYHGLPLNGNSTQGRKETFSEVPK